MKQNNANMLFKSLALCFLILGNLISDVVCDAPRSTPSITPTVPVTVEEKEVTVPKTKACDAIKEHYKMKSTENFFQSLNAAANTGDANYKFLFNSPKTGQEILEEEIKATNKKMAPEAFDAFKTIVKETTTAVNELKTPADVSATVLQTFMTNFKFEGGKFVLNGTESAISLDAIAENLVVYLKDLAILKSEVKGITTTVTINEASGKTLIDAHSKLEEAKNKKQAAESDKQGAVNINDDDAKEIAEAKIIQAGIEITTAEAELKTAKQNALQKAVDQARDAVKAKVENAVENKPTGSPTPLKDLLDALNNYHIKTEYTYNSAGGGAASVTVTYSIVDVSTITSTNDPNISATKLDIKAADIDKSKKFLLKFIDTSKGLAKDVFVAISEQCASAAVTDANVHFKAILTKLESDFTKTVEDALNKTVTKDQFNAAFKLFATESDVDVAETDIGDKINLCWLSNVTDPGKQFDNYIAWLKSGDSAKLAKATFNTKEEAVNAFFKVLQDNLADYKKKLQDDLNPTVTPTGGNKTGEEQQSPTESELDEGTGGKPQSPKGKELKRNTQPKSETKMSTTKKVAIFGSALTALLVIVGSVFVILGRNYFSTKETAAA